MKLQKQAVTAIFLTVLVLLGCKLSKTNKVTTTTNNSNSGNKTAPQTKVNDDGTISSGVGEEKEKPAPGKANVQGKVFYNEKPAAGVEVKLCEKFNQFFGGCKGETFVTKTDNNGEYLLKN